MSDTVIKVSNLSKLYRIGETIRHDTLRDAIAHFGTQMVNKLRRSPTTDNRKPLTANRTPQTAQNSPPTAHRSPLTETIWALKDVSFEVKRGEIVGVIGRNGAGKSTLLKILSRITEPTEGKAEIHGRVGSLLEVGTGFHGELTGRENVFLNGAILGMTKREIKNKFDEIVSFAEVEKFIDTPVKRYSSGMHVRLAFAVAAHLEPEILLVDEVLAVGDYEFQKKCFGKMEDIGREGRTIVLVSHNMPSIMNLCKRAIMLNSGKVMADGPVANVVQGYLSSSRSTGGEMVWSDPDKAPGNDIVRLYAVRILQDGIDGPTADIDISKEVQIQITYWNLREDALLYTAIFLKDGLGTSILASSNHKSISLTQDSWNGRFQPRGLFQSVCRIPGNFLNEGLYRITPIVGKAPFETQLLEEDLLSFNVHDTGSMRKEFYGGWLGVVRPRLAWQTVYMGSAMKPAENVK